MKKMAVAGFMWLLGATLAYGQVMGTCQSLIVPHADLVFMVQGQALQDRPFIQKAMSLNEKCPQVSADNSPELKAYAELLSSLNVDGKHPNPAEMTMGSLAFNNLDPAKPSMDPVEFVLGAKFRHPLKGRCFQTVLSKVLNTCLKLDSALVAVESFQQGRCEGARIKVADTVQTAWLPAMLKRTVLAVIDGTTVVFGNEAAVLEAVKRMEAGVTVPLDPFITANLKGDMSLVMRMIPALKTLLVAFQNPEMPFLADLAKGAGLVLTATVQEQMDMEMAFHCAKPQEALAFKRQLWDPQIAVLIGMLGGSIKAQSDYKITCLDKLVCVADGSNICIRMPFTIQDLEGYYQLMQTMMLAKAKTMAQPAEKPSMNPTQDQKSATGHGQIAP